MTYIDVTNMVGHKKELKGYFSKHDTLKVDKGTNELLLMIHVNKTPDEMTWFLDSRCCNHICDTINSFHN
jgi:hypothetical protein